MRIPLLSKVSLLALALILPAALAISACGNGNDNSTDLAPMIKVQPIELVPPFPLQSDKVVFFNKLSPAGDTFSLDVAVHDDTGTLDLDDIDIVLRYDTTFMQLVDIRSETLFGSCGAVNTACNRTSPVCVNNQASANGGGERFCRSNGSTPCLKDTDCTATGDSCGDFGRLQAAFAVITGPKTCSNDSTHSCTQGSDCHLCTSDVSIPCANNAQCTGTCVSSVCSGGGHAGDPCIANIDCFDTCNVSATCNGCPSKVVSGTQSIVNLRFRVIDTGRSELRLVTSGSSQAVASFLRKDTLDIGGVQFWPDVDASDVTDIDNSTILIEATK
ncbi:MAG TPA: hypothetical protein VFW45_06180 [Candidatus Polarisedimenticolia bacterium]|nr:hypothetical protein [Candidatus Polarisedimenticolia bacterium]